VADFEDILDHVEDLVVAERLAHAVELLQEAHEHLALAGVRRDEVEYLDFVLLAVAVDSPHSLFQPVRVPRQIPVDHHPAELEVDALTGGICPDQELGVLPEPLFGGDAVLELHAPVDDADGTAPLAKLSGQVLQGVPVLGKDEDLLVTVGHRLLLDYPLQLFQLPFGPGPHRLLGLGHEAIQLRNLGVKLRDGAGR
jgi:hypothetical protein